MLSSWVITVFSQLKAELSVYCDVVCLFRYKDKIVVFLFFFKLRNPHVISYLPRLSRTVPLNERIKTHQGSRKLRICLRRQARMPVGRSESL